MRLLREKSVRMAELFADLVEQECPGEFTLASPREASLRGSQACLSHPDAAAVMRRLIARGVIGDFRPPDVLRFGITPLFLRYADLWDAVAALRGSV
jgi:kynureninase